MKPQSSMHSWSVLERNDDVYKPLVCIDGPNANFSVVVAAVLRGCDALPDQITTSIRRPYVAVHFEDCLAVVSSLTSELVLFKSFGVRVLSAFVRLKRDEAIVFLEDDRLVTIRLDDTTESHVVCTIPTDNFQLAFALEMQEDNESILLVNSRRSIFPDYVLSLGDLSLVAVREDNVPKETQLLRTNRHRLHKSSLCLRPTLENDGIDVHCPVTKQSYVVAKIPDVHDLKTFQHADKILIRSVLPDGSCTVSIINFDNFESKFCIKVLKDSALVGGIDDFAIYSEFKDDMLFLYVVKEISPLSQLEMLISIGNYEAAEQFAKAHNLTPIAVMEIKAKCLVNNLKHTYSEENLIELQNILSKHGDVCFVTGCACEVVEANPELYPLLKFAKEIAVGADNLALNKRIDELLWKVEAFQLIRLEYENPASWEDFVAESAVGLCKIYITENLLDCATIIWTKSYRVNSPTLKVRDVADLLCSISLDTKLNALLRWLEYFIPDVNSLMPYSADLVITWAKDRICVLENSVHWPEVGIQFAEKFSSLMFHSKGMISFMPPSAEKVFQLINFMIEIQVLKKDYNIIVSLRDFTTLCGNELAKLILRKAFTEDLTCLFKKFLNNYILKHNLSYDILLREHIEELISLSPTIDEQRMDILLNSIYNLDEKYQCIIMVLKAAAIPWSKVITNIADKAIASKHNLVSKIQVEMMHAKVKAVLTKYKCLDLSSDDFEYLIHLIVKKGDKDMLKDLETITNVYYKLKEDAYMLCIQNYIENNDIQKALDVFNSLTDFLKTSCINALTIVLESQLDSIIKDKQLERNFIDFLRSTGGVDASILNSLANVYILKNRFDVHILCRDYFIKEYRRYSFITWCRQKIEYMNTSEGNLREILNTTLIFGQYLKFSRAETVDILIEHINKNMLPILANIVMIEKYHLFDNSMETVELILKLAPAVNVTDFHYLENSMKYLFEVIKECNSKYLNYFLSICSWFTSIYFIHNSIREVLNKWSISYYFNPHTINSIVPVWKEIIVRNAMVNFEQDQNICLCQPGKECLNGSVCLLGMLKKSQIQQNDIHFTKVISYCMNWHFNNGMDIPQWLNDLCNDMAKVLISKITLCEKVDNALMSSLLFSLSSSSEWINDILLNNSIQPCKKINVAYHVVQCKNLYYHCNVSYPQALIIYSQNVISKRFKSYGVLLNKNQDESYNFSLLLDGFIKMNVWDISILEEFCKVIDVDFDQALLCYLFYLLKCWNDEYMFEYDNFNNCKISAMEQTTQQKCMLIAERIKCKEQLTENLTLLFKNGEVNIQNMITISINIYCYEVNLFVLDLLKKITGTQHFLREYMLLKFLQTYQRVTKPKQSELDEFSMKEQYPKIGYYRLPSQSVICENFWKNLKPEVTLETYKQWLPIAGLLPLNVDLQVSRDMICSNAVKQSMTAEKNSHENVNTKWNLHLKNGRLLKQAHECVQHISNLEWAGACFYYVFQGSALGADQVAAVDMCYQFAEHWAKVEPNHNVVKKMQTKHLLTSTAHILHKIGLAEDGLLSLCDNPQKLIEALYSHPSIVTKYENSSINNAVDEIAEKHNLSAGSLRLRILERILNANNVLSSNSLSNKSVSYSDGTLSRELLMRACYILKGTNQMTAALYLSRMGLGNNELSEHNTNIRALQCLLSLADSDVIEKVTKHRVYELWAKLWEVYFTNGLNIIGMEYLVSLFHEDKLQLVRQLWNSRDRSNLTVSLIIKMMIIYNLQICNEELDDIIKTVIKLDMIFEVETFLSSVKLIYSPNYLNMWNYVLLTPFKRLDTPLIGHQKEECYDALRRLPLCPIINQIDLSLIWRNCLKLGMTEMAVLVLPHMSTENRKQLVGKIGKIRKSTIQELKTIKSKGVLTTSMVMNILKQELR